MREKWRQKFIVPRLPGPAINLRNRDWAGGPSTNRPSEAQLEGGGASTPSQLQDLAEDTHLAFKNNNTNLTHLQASLARIAESPAVLPATQLLRFRNDGWPFPGQWRNWQENQQNLCTNFVHKFYFASMLNTQNNQYTTKVILMRHFTAELALTHKRKITPDQTPNFHCFTDKDVNQTRKSRAAQSVVTDHTLAIPTFRSVFATKKTPKQTVVHCGRTLTFRSVSTQPKMP